MNRSVVSFYTLAWFLFHISFVYGTSFQVLEQLVGINGSINDMSDDATTFIIDYGSGGSFYWKNGIKTQVINEYYGHLYALSGNGNIVVGRESSQAFMWCNNQIQYLDSMPGYSYSTAYDCSYDGSVIVGISGGETISSMGCVWKEGIVQETGVLPDKTVSWTSKVSGDGAVVIGASGNRNPSELLITDIEAFQWRDGVIEGLDMLPGATCSYANAISYDGEVIVGYSGPKMINVNNYWLSACKWEAGVLTALFVPSEYTLSSAWAISQDGSIIGGQVGNYIQSGNTWSREYQAALWDEIHGLRLISDILSNEGIDLTGWELENVMAISADGRFIMGTGDGPGSYNYWIAEIPEPTTALLLVLGGIALTCRRKKA